MLNKTISLPKIYDGIQFGEIETTTEIVFHGKFHDSSGIPYISQGCGMRYGNKGNKFYLAVGHYPMLYKVVLYMREKYPQYRIECTVKKDEKETSGYVCAAEMPNEDWELGIVVICLEHEI